MTLRLSDGANECRIVGGSAAMGTFGNGFSEESAARPAVAPNGNGRVLAQIHG